MPYGKGTYGSKMGRPVKKDMKKKPKAKPMKKMMMPRESLTRRLRQEKGMVKTVI